MWSLPPPFYSKKVVEWTTWIITKTFCYIYITHLFIINMFLCISKQATDNSTLLVPICIGSCCCCFFCLFLDRRLKNNILNTKVSKPVMVTWLYEARILGGSFRKIRISRSVCNTKWPKPQRLGMKISRRGFPSLAQYPAFDALVPQK